MGVKERVDLISNNTNLSVDMLPTTVKIELTGVCSLQCKFCFNQYMRKNNIRQTFMTKDMFERIVSEMKKLPSIKEVSLFYMGESGLHPKLSRYYQILKENGYFTYLTTNGTILANIKAAIPYVDSLKISWNYKNVNDFMNKTSLPKNMYETIKTNIESLYIECHKHNKQLAISTVLDGYKEEYEDSLKELVYDEHYWLPLQTQGGIIEGNNGVIGEYDNPSTPIPCWSLFKGLYFDVDGNVRCCCYGHNDCHILGNIMKQDIRDILSSSKLLEMRQLHLNHIIPEECKECLR